jgi:hypothetical protein
VTRLLYLLLNGCSFIVFARRVRIEVHSGVKVAIMVNCRADRHQLDDRVKSLFRGRFKVLGSGLGLVLGGIVL